MASQYKNIPGSGVTSINNETGDITLVAGSGISITPSGQNITIAATGGSGTVTSVGLADSNGLFNITGSPVTTSGTLTLASLKSQTANYFFAAPNGSSGAPTFRALVSSDLPAGTGTVTSVALTSPGVLYTVSGSPITTSGTLALNLISQSQNSVLAGPTSGSGTPSFRALVSGDIPSLSGIYLPLAGGTMSGNINLGTNNLINIGSVGIGTISPGGPLDVYSVNGRQFEVLDAGANTVNYLTATGASTGNTPTLAAAGSDTNVNLNFQTQGTGTIRFNTGGGTQVKIFNKASAVNFFTLIGAATGGSPAVNVGGSDTNIGLQLTTQGTGSLSFQTGHGQQIVVADGGVSTVNYLQIQGSPTGSGPIISALGSDSNVNLTLTPKGAGNTIISTGNLSAANMISGYTSTATAGTTTTLVVGSNRQQYFTGSTTQTIVMPVTSTLVLGQQYAIVNLSTGVVTVQSSGANTIQAMASNSQITLTCISTSLTTAAAWSYTYSTLSSGAITALTGDVTATGPGSVAASLVATTNSTLTTLSGLTTASSLSTVGTIGTGTWQGSLLGATYGGTGVANPTAHQIPVAEGSSAMTFISPSTSGFVLTSNGTGSDPSFQVPINCSARYVGSSSTISSTTSLITFSTKDYDTDNAYSSGLFTVPAGKAGKYSITSGIIYSATLVAGTGLGQLQIYKNGVSITNAFLYASNTAFVGVLVLDILNLAAGDTIGIQGSCNGTTPTIGASTTRNWFSIAMVSP